MPVLVRTASLLAAGLLIGAVVIAAVLLAAGGGSVPEPRPGGLGERLVDLMRWSVFVLLAAGTGIGTAGFLLRHREFAADGSPRRIGPYRLLALVGEGALSNVWLAEHQLMRRKVALKMLKTHAASDEWIERFRREVQLAGNLRHANFARLYDFGTVPGGGFYYAMEYIDGVTLAQLVERDGPLSPTHAARILRDIGVALDEMHALGLLHRDIKPQNVMLCAAAGEGGEIVKVLDFGLVKRMDGNATRDLTAGLHILGTPAYLAPERIEAPASTDPRSDLYAVGALAFYLLTGRKPFEAEGDLHLTHLILDTPARAPGAVNPGNSTPALDALILRCLAKSPDERPASARVLADEFAALAGEQRR